MRNPRRDSNCCWTCRLRRKKCDRRRPVCSACQTLGITCHRHAQRPDWLDGGSKQKRMSDSIKTQIRSHAEQQRALKDGNDRHFGMLSLVTEHRTESDRSPLSIHSSDRDSTPASGPPSVMVGSADSILNWPSSLLGDSPALNHFEVSFLSKYLDDVAPFLFPYYRPSMMETGRDWITSLVQHSEVARHAILSLTAYFFTVCLQDTYPGEFEPCKQEIWSHLKQHTNGYFAQIQEEITLLGTKAGGARVLSQARSMESIIQVLLFEVILGRSDSWILHLKATLGLFADIFGVQTQGSDKPPFLSIILGFGDPAWYTQKTDSYVWNTEQAGFRFFTALLIFLDVIGSTALGQGPRLLHHIPVLLAGDDGESELPSVTLRLSEYVGCENWVIIAIAQTSALAQWKKEAKANMSLSVMELTEKARLIEESLQRGISRLENYRLDPNDGATRASQRRSRSWYGRPPLEVSTHTASMIWAQTALLYLAVVVSGWQPCSAVVRAGVRKALALMQDIKSPSHFHALTWPFVVAGCLAEPGEERSRFLAIFDQNRNMGMYGVMADAHRILQKTWSQDVGEDWDLASCFGILGYSALLV